MLKKSVLIALASALPGLAAAQAAGDAAKQKVSMCIGCHGIPEYKASFPSVYRVPKIAGQNEGYLVNALKAYKSGDRQHPTMTAQASSFSDQDIADIAAYLSAQKAK